MSCGQVGILSKPRRSQAQQKHGRNRFKVSTKVSIKCGVKVVVPLHCATEGIFRHLFILQYISYWTWFCARVIQSIPESGADVKVKKRRSQSPVFLQRLSCFEFGKSLDCVRCQGRPRVKSLWQRASHLRHLVRHWGRSTTEIYRVFSLNISKQLMIKHDKTNIKLSWAWMIFFMACD